MNLSLIASKKWFIVAIVLFLLFTLFTPINVYHKMGFYLSMIEGLICGVFVFMGMVEVNSVNDLFFLNEEDYPRLKEGITIYVPLTLLLVSSLIFSYSTTTKINNLIKEKGIVSQAIINSGFQTTSTSLRRGSSSSYHLQLSFKLQSGAVFTAGSDVSSDVYNHVSLGQRVEVKYLPENPAIFIVMAGNKNVQDFAGVSNRDLEFKDLEKIMSLSLDSTKAYLNTISVKWDYHKKNDVYFFVNESKKEVVAKIENGKVLYKGDGINIIDNFIRDLTITDKKEETIRDDPNFIIKNIKTFTTDKYIIQYMISTSKQDMRIEVYLTLQLKR